MRLLMIIFAMLLASCGPDRVQVVEVQIPADLLVTEPGWQGRAPETRADFVAATEAEKAGRISANRKIEAIAEIVGSAGHY